MHAVGEGTTRNLAEAARRYEQAAIRGNVLAQRLLAQLHYQGIDGAPNLATGARWLKSAADAGDLVAMQDFAMRLAFGEGTDHNLTEAYRYLLLASKHPDAEVVGIQNILTRLRRVEQSLTQQQIDEVNRVVNEAMKNSAKPMAGP